MGHPLFLSYRKDLVTLKRPHSAQQTVQVPHERGVRGAEADLSLCSLTGKILLL